MTMLEAMLGEIRDGFASIRAQGQAGALDRRVDELERSMEFVKRRIRRAD